jgi:DNA-binding NarL/FixJ family response regulator
MSKPRILIAEDHTLVAEAFQKLLEPHYEVVGVVSDGRSLVTEAQRLNPNIVIVDVAMPLLNGLDASRQLKTRMPHIKVIFVTMNEDHELAAEALRAGASGYLLKTSASSELLRAVQEVLRGKSYITPRISEQLLGDFIRDPRADQSAKHLTMRQREVLQLLAEGRSMKEAADILRITPRTIAFHKYRAMEQFDIKSNAELIRFVIRQGLLKAS